MYCVRTQYMFHPSEIFNKVVINVDNVSEWSGGAVVHDSSSFLRLTMKRAVVGGRKLRTKTCIDPEVVKGEAIVS